MNWKGNVAKPLRLVLGACIIQAEYGFSDEETPNVRDEKQDYRDDCERVEVERYFSLVNRRAAAEKKELSWIFHYHCRASINEEPRKATGS